MSLVFLHWFPDDDDDDHATGSIPGRDNLWDPKRILSCSKTTNSVGRRGIVFGGDDTGLWYDHVVVSSILSSS